MFCNILVNSVVCILTVLCPRCSYKDHKYSVKDTTITFNSINYPFPKHVHLLGEDQKKSP